MVAADLEMPVHVILERREVDRGFWSQPVWELRGVLGNLARPGGGAREIHHGEQARQILWPGLKLRLFRDEAESYWHNLVADAPSVFVICHPDEDTPDPVRQMRPVLVSVNGDDASAHTEADDLVLSAPMPAEIYQRLEAFVLDHYRPQPRHKRKRKNWTEEEHGGRRPPGPR